MESALALLLLGESNCARAWALECIHLLVKCNGIAVLGGMILAVLC